MTDAAPTPLPPRPPVAPRRPHVHTMHGDRRPDDHAWLRHRDDPEVLAYLRAENAYTEAMTAHTAELRETLYREILGRIQETDQQVPVKDGAWRYYSRTEAGLAYPIHCRRALDADAPETVILDENVEAEGLAFFELGAFEVSPSGRYLAVLVDTDGHEDFVLRVRDLQHDRWLPDRVEQLSWGLAWASDDATLYYVRGDDAKRPHEVWRHRLGTPTGDDVRVFREDDVTFNVGVARTRSGRFVLLHTHSFTQDEWHCLDADDPASTPRVIVPRTAGLEYSVDHGGDWFHVVTNRDGATNFCVMRAPVSAPADWTPVVPHRADVFVEALTVFRDWSVREERREGLRRLVITALDDGAAHEIAFPDAAYGVSLGANPEFDADTLRFTYSSFITPASVFDYDLRARTRTLRKQQAVLGGYDPAHYVVERLGVAARDGTTIPVSILTHRDVPREGPAPTLLYAYGAYGATMEPTFSSARLSLVDRGIRFAIAHVRGGQEMGRPWYDAGKMLRKWNTFHDFIDVAEGLIASGRTQPDRLVAHGGSAGGLLMGVVANERPDLFRAIVADVPFVDVLTTMLDASIPLTAQEWEQWGDPRDPAAYAYIRTYSPYDNVRAQAYPWMLVMSGINDSRVAYWEPAKWVARLRATRTDDHPLLLQMQLTAGHGGASGRYEQIRETAFRFAFMLDALSPGAAGAGA